MRISRIRTVFAGLILASLAGQAVAETAVNTTPTAATRAEGWRSDLDLQRWNTTTFHNDLSNAIRALSAAHGITKDTVMLDIAEIYLTHMLLYEAKTTLDGLDPATPEQTRRFLALQHATALLSGQAVEGFQTSALNTPKRPDRAFWAALQAIATADAGMLSANIRGSFAGLGLQSRAALRQMLPVFIEAATELGEQAHADAGLKLLAELPDLADSPTGHFLRGRVEERRGNASSALKAYFSAAEGWDQYAARARLAVADMSLRDGGSGALLAAQSVLQEGAEAWRGDRYELEVIKRMVRLYAATENELEELLALGKLLVRFPLSSEAASGKGQAGKLLQRLYSSGNGGQYPLSNWMAAHLSLLPFYGGFPEFPEHTEVLADYVLELGATDLAAKEYRRAIREIERRDAPHLKPDAIRLTLKLADAQRRAGLLVEARETLTLLGLPETGPDRDTHNALLAQVLSALNDGPALLQTTVAAPTPGHLRDMGKAFADAEKWGDATTHYLRLWDGHPQEFAFEDATRLLIAANRAGDAATISRVARAFPQLTSSASLIELAQSLHAGTADLLPLSAEKAADRLQSLEDAFQSIKDTSGSP
jgi:hypothetical protein